MAEIGTPKAREREGSAPEGGASPRVTSQNNPLLQLGFDIPFDALLPEHVEPAVAELLARSRRNIEAIENDPAPPTYDNTLDLTQSSSYNGSFVTGNGGTTTSAESALLSAIASGKAYLNIHTTTFGAGEIRGFLVPEPATLALLAPAAALSLRRRRAR